MCKLNHCWFDHFCPGISFPIYCDLSFEFYFVIYLGVVFGIIFCVIISTRSDGVYVCSYRRILLQ